MAKPPKFTVVRSPDGLEKQHVLDPERYEGWEVLGTHVGELGPDEEWDDKAKKPKVIPERKAKREREAVARDPLALLDRIEKLEALVAELTQKS